MRDNYDHEAVRNERRVLFAITRDQLLEALPDPDRRALLQKAWAVADSLPGAAARYRWRKRIRAINRRFTGLYVII